MISTSAKRQQAEKKINGGRRKLAKEKKKKAMASSGRKPANERSYESAGRPMKGSAWRRKEGYGSEERSVAA